MMDLKKTRKNVFSRVLLTIVIILCAVIICLYGLVSLFVPKKLEQKQMPQIFGKTFIAVTDAQFDTKVQKNALVFGNIKESYEVGSIVSVALSSSDLVSVTPNTCADIAVVQIIEANDTTYTVRYNDPEQVFYVGEDAVLSEINFQIAHFGKPLIWMLRPRSYLFWLFLPLLVLILCVVILSYLKERRRRLSVERQKENIASEKSVKAVKKTTAPKKDAPPQEKKKEHPLLSKRAVQPEFEPEETSEEENDLLGQISEKFAQLSKQDEKVKESIEQQLDSWKNSSAQPQEASGNAARTAAEGGNQAKAPVGSAPAAPKTTVVFQVGERKAVPKEERVVTDDDLDLIMLQDKIESIINNNNRRMEDEVESKLRGRATEKELAARELEKTREFFISPTHLNAKKEKK